MVAMEKLAQIKADRECQDRAKDCILVRVVGVCLTKVTLEQRI